MVGLWLFTGVVACLFIVASCGGLWCSVTLLSAELLFITCEGLCLTILF